MAPLLQDVLGTDVVSPYDELMAYEYLYSREGSTLKKIVEATVLSNKLPREVLYDLYGFVAPDDFDEVSLWVAQQMGDFAIAVNQTPSWPTALCDSKRPSPLLYYRGDINLIESRTISCRQRAKQPIWGRREPQRWHGIYPQMAHDCNGLAAE